jgi:hypothetical protein
MEPQSSLKPMENELERLAGAHRRRLVGSGSPLRPAPSCGTCCADADLLPWWST